MSSAISLGTLPAMTANGPSRTTLDAEIARYQKQLADCVTCSSAKTPQGKANIQQLTGKISADEQQLQQIDQAASSHATGATPSGAAAGAGYTARGAPASSAGPAAGALLSILA